MDLKSAYNRVVNLFIKIIRKLRKGIEIEKEMIYTQDNW